MISWTRRSAAARESAIEGVLVSKSATGYMLGAGSALLGRVVLERDAVSEPDSAPHLRVRNTFVGAGPPAPAGE